MALVDSLQDVGALNYPPTNMNVSYKIRAIPEKKWQ
jgi:hypothetical protein